MSESLPVDKDGFLTVTLGMFDKEIPTEVFEEFKTRCKTGQVYSELGYPRKEEGVVSEEYFKRLMRADDKNIAAQIVDVEMSGDGKRMIGKVLPAGPHGDMLSKLLDSRDAVFGMRSFHDTRDKEQKRPMHVATYDIILPK